MLDTVAFIFWHGDNPRLRARVRSALLESLRRPISVSATTAFKISTKVRLGKLSVPAAILNDFAYLVESDGFRVLDLDAPTAIRAGQLPGDHRDSFDRLLGAQAIALRAAILTNDPLFTALGVEVFW